VIPSIAVMQLYFEMAENDDDDDDDENTKIQQKVVK